jgi:hypothetical protein
MAEIVQGMRSDALQQRGTFEGSETSGASVLNNIRISYRIPREAPDKIQFAYYNLDSLSRGSGRIRGAGFEFNFERPINITQTIQMVRIGIESNGGTFNGNEQQGIFQANGIAGQYRVSDRVIVTITDKPVLVPNSLIEREVKNYFGGQ